MQINEFIDETSDIEKYYAKELDEFQRKIWFDELKDISLSRYRQIIREIFRTSKFMPRLSDILEVHRNLSFKREETQEEKVQCDKCNSEGYILYTKMFEGIPYIYAARCTCKNGDSYRYDGRKLQKDKSKYYIPSIEEVEIGE